MTPVLNYFYKTVRAALVIKLYLTIMVSQGVRYESLEFQIQLFEYSNRVLFSVGGDYLIDLQNNKF